MHHIYTTMAWILQFHWTKLKQDTCHFFCIIFTGCSWYSSHPANWANPFYIGWCLYRNILKHCRQKIQVSRHFISVCILLLIHWRPLKYHKMLKFSTHPADNPVCHDCCYSCWRIPLTNSVETSCHMPVLLHVHNRRLTHSFCTAHCPYLSSLEARPAS